MAGLRRDARDTREVNHYHVTRIKQVPFPLGRVPPHTSRRQMSSLLDRVATGASLRSTTASSA